MRLIALSVLLALSIPAFASPAFDTKPTVSRQGEAAQQEYVAGFCRDAGLLMAELDEQRHPRIQAVDPRNRRLIAFLHELNCRRDPNTFINEYFLAVEEYQMSFR